jgi:glycerate kinase
VKILVIPDKFKGTLTADAAARSIVRGWRRARPDDAIESLPMSDGGDGFGVAVGTLLRAQIQKIKTVDAAHRNCVANWWWEPRTKTAVIESANVIGLAKLPAGKFHPFDLDTFGLGAVIRAAARKGAKRCIIGIGGSATNDGGFGLARALGWKFLDRDGQAIERWTDLRRLASIARPKRSRWFREMIVAVDVRNPLLGLRGATRIYGPQKGLRSEDFALAESCLLKLVKVSSGDASALGAGAAGGLGFGLMTFPGAKMEPGFDLFARLADLEKRLRSVDLVITGEGRIDASTFMGKGAGEVGARCRKWKVPCIAFAGEVAARPAADRVFAQVHALTDLTTARAAKAKAEYWLERLAERTAGSVF